MKHTKRSAFTIVELVIVIAVIAILSAVLIPTFGAIIRDANEAADKTAASTLTSELHIHLKGNTIDSEEELMAALKDSGIGEKLVPKALAYGHHFWFNMETQSIFAAYPDDVAKMEPAKLSASVNQDGPVLASEVTPIADTTDYANVGIRDVYDKGYYLISNCGDLADALNRIETLASAKDYEDLIKDLNDAVTFDTDNTAATAVLNKVKETTIRTQYGVFFYDGASTYEHISSAASYLSGSYYNYNPTSGKAETATAAPNVSKPVSIPSNIKAVMEGGLNYETAQGTTVEMPSVNAVIDIFTPASTNAIISIKGAQYIVTTAACDEHNDTCDVLAKKDGTVVDHLELKLAFEDFYIGYEAKTDNTTTDRLVEDSTEPNKVYVAYRNGRLQLFAVNTDNTDETSSKVMEWKIDETATNYGTFDIDPKTGAIDLTTAEYAVVDGKYVCEINVKAIAKNLNGNIVEDTITVVVIKPVTATLNLGSTKLAFSNPPATYPALTFNGPLTSYGVSATVTYSGDIDETDPLNLRNNYVLDIDTDNIVGLLYDGSKMSFKTNGDGELISNTYSFTVSVDGCFETVVSGEIADATAAPVRFNYKQYNQGDRPQQYYVGTSAAEGSNKVMLSDLFTLSEVNKAKLGNATVTIYVDAELDGSLFPSYEIRKVFKAYADQVAAGDMAEEDNPFTLNAKYTDAVTERNWNSASIEFIGTITSEYTIYVEISPEFDVSTVVRLEVVNGVINVSNLNDLTADANGKITLGGNVALHGDCKIETGTTIDVGANTLYGNGWVIDAEEYTNEVIIETTKTEKISAWTECTVCGNKNVSSWDPSDRDCREYYTDDGCGDAYGHRVDGSLISHPEVTKTITYYCSNPEAIELINLAGGTIENIYINGPVYPDLQYGIGDCEIDGHDDHNLFPYFVSGIKTSGNATINDSYIKGFRQPVLVAGAAAVGELEDITNNNGTPDDTSDDYADKTVNVTKEAENTTIKNTVLHGGNYANLNIVSGNVTLTDVTTIQDFDGMVPTVNYDSNKDDFTVVGAGIVLEYTTAPDTSKIQSAIDLAEQLAEAGRLGSDSDAKEQKIGALIKPLSTKIDINGSFTQHNWIEKNLGNKKVPVIPVYTGKDVDLKFIFSTIFYGVTLDSIGEVISSLAGLLGIPNNIGRMGRFLFVTHQDVAVNEGNEGNRITDTSAVTHNATLNELINLGIMFADVAQSEGDAVVGAALTKYIIDIDETDSNSKKHSHVSLQLKEDISVGSMNATVLTDGADASLAVWSYTDGRQWVSTRGSNMVTISTIKGDTKWNDVITVTNDDKYYAGYYATSDAYKNLHFWEINN